MPCIFELSSKDSFEISRYLFAFYFSHTHALLFPFDLHDNNKRFANFSISNFSWTVWLLFSFFFGSFLENICDATLKTFCRQCKERNVKFVHSPLLLLLLRKRDVRGFRNATVIHFHNCYTNDNIAGVRGPCHTLSVLFTMYIKCTSRIWYALPAPSRFSGEIVDNISFKMKSTTAVYCFIFEF